MHSKHQRSIGLREVARPPVHDPNVGILAEVMGLLGLLVGGALLAVLVYLIVTGIRFAF